MGEVGNHSVSKEAKQLENFTFELFSTDKIALPELLSVNIEVSHPVKGIFWVIAEYSSLNPYSLLALDGSTAFTSRKMESHTHKTAWALRAELFCRHPLYHTHIKQKPFDYYPRGRVELRERSGAITATIWLNPLLNYPNILAAISQAFCLRSCKEIHVKEDHSRHYRHHLFDTLDKEENEYD